MPTVAMTAEDQRPDVLSAEQRRAAHQYRYDLAGSNAGWDMRGAVKVHWKDASYTSWDEALAELAGGIIVTVPCDSGSRGGRTRHKVRFAPDGAIILLDHPDHVLYVEGELMLAALGGSMCGCVAVAVYLTIRQLVPKTVNADATAINVRLRALHSAVAWAQHPGHVWEPDFGDSNLRYGITPQVLAAWEADGWDCATALPFLRSFAKREVANAWREVGQCTQRAAKLAGRGEYPDEERRWAEVGFSPSRSAKWRATNLSPEDAWEWERHRISPTSAPLLMRYSRDYGFSIEQAKEWCGAGISPSYMPGWYLVAEGDLGLAVRWHKAGVRPSGYRRVQEWNETNTDAPLNLEVVGAYVKAGIDAQTPHLISLALGSGVSAESYRDAVQSLNPARPDPLWHALLAQANRTSDAPWWMLKDPTFYGYAIRCLRKGTIPGLTGFVLEWLRINSSSH